MATSGNLGAIGSGEAFAGFEPADFDAYASKKHSSNAYTLERRRVKDRLLSLTRTVEAALEETLGGLELGASDEQPSIGNGRKVQAQWAFFTRPSNDRAALKTLLQRTDLQSASTLFDIAVHHQHAVLALRVDLEGFVASVEIATKATVDRENVSKKLEQKWAREKLLELAHALPAEAKIGLGNHLVDAVSLDEPTVQDWASELAKSDQSFLVELGIPRDMPLLASVELVPIAGDMLVDLLPIYRFLAWSRDNDHTSVKDAVQKEKKVRQEKVAAFEPGDRVTILSGLFAGRGGYLAEVIRGKAKVMVGPVAVTVDVKDIKAS